MAWVTKRKRKNGIAFLIEFSLNGRKKSLFLPREYDEKDARQIAGVVSRVCDAIETGAQLDRQTFAWLSNAPQTLVERFERAGLVEPSERLTIGELVERYFDAEDRRLKPESIRVKRWAVEVLFGEINKKTPLEKLTVAKMRDAFDRIRDEYAPASYSHAARTIKRVFAWAIENEIVEKNPMIAVHMADCKNKAREYFVDRETFAKILDVAPSLEWRTLLALWRFGGLRRSEAFLVDWRDVNFPEGRLIVHSPKTERHKGKGFRVVPLFPELRSELERLFDSLPEGSSPRVIATIEPSAVKYSFERILFNAGVQLWPRLIQNLRSSRSIEIYREFGAIAESEWVGHGVDVAKNHYLHLLDDDYRRAAFPSEEKSVGFSVDKIELNRVK